MYRHSIIHCLLLLATVLALAGCQAQDAPPSLEASREANLAQFLLINQSTLPGFYGVCTLDGELLDFKVRSAEYVERMRLERGYHRVECHAEALSLQMSFDCEHDFQVYADEPVYLSLSGRTVPGACRLKRLSFPPEDFARDYAPAQEPL